MIKSPWDTDILLGLQWYSTTYPGIGGTLRTIPEDFQVEEIAVHKPGSGPYLLCRMTKRNWDQHRAVKAIASGLAISHQRIGFAGTKDKRAVTSQFISLYGITKEQVQGLSIPGISLLPVGHTQHQITLGDLSGNHFSIRIRDIEDRSALSDMEKVRQDLGAGIPNYVGYQRFGVTRPITHLIGLEILKGNYREAVRLMIGKPGTAMKEQEREGRACYQDTENPADALHLFPARLSLERSILHYLVKNQGDYEGALRSLPRTLRSMYVSAVQSWLFNLALSTRIQEGRSLAEPETGDRLVWPDGREDQVTEQTLRAAQVQVKRERCSIALLLPGEKNVPEKGADDKNLAYLLEENGLTTSMFGEVSSVLETTFAGSFRQVLMKTSISLEPLEEDVCLHFVLHPGQYATTVLRELMKTNPIKMV